MPMQVTVHDDILTQGKPFHEVEKAVREGLVIRAYLNAEISPGELAELMGMKYLQARDWLHGQGIATTRNLPSVLEKTDTSDDNENLTMIFLEKCGGWQDTRSPEEIISDTCDSRTISDRGTQLFEEDHTRLLRMMGDTLWKH